MILVQNGRCLYFDRIIEREENPLLMRQARPPGIVEVQAMTLNDYLMQYKRNMVILSGGESEEPESGNTDLVIGYLYNNRRRYFRSVKELENLILETEEIAINGTVGESRLPTPKQRGIGDGRDRKRNRRVAWDRFMRIFYWMLTSQCLRAEEIAAYSEYAIPFVGRSLSDGGRTAMLISTYVFMRFDLPCPEYTSKDEYVHAAVREKVRTYSEQHRLFSNPEFRSFVSYYRSICPSKDRGYSNALEKADDGAYVYYLTGSITEERSCEFRQNIEEFYEEHGDISVIFDCSMLAWIDMEGIRVLKDLKESGRRFELQNLNADCKVLFKVEGLDAYLGGDDKLPKIDLSSCEKINEGAEGVIYRVSDEVVAKTFKNEPDYYEIVRHRIALKNALICGVPAPFTFGYAEYDGKIVTLMELIDSKSLLQIFSEEEDIDEYIIRYAQFIKQLHEIQDETRLGYFMRNLFGKELLSKADRCDGVLREEYRGRAREIIEALDEPECLVHGDIHPKNIMLSGDEMIFIDFDSFSTGKAAYDLGALYRSLLCAESRGISDMNSFLKLPFDKCQRIWDLFIAEYFKGEQEEIVHRRIAAAELIGAVLALARIIKDKDGPDMVSRWAAELERKIINAGV